jgi:hypothetical protein
MRLKQREATKNGRLQFILGLLRLADDGGGVLAVRLLCSG